MIGSIFSKTVSKQSTHVPVRTTLENYSPLEESIPFMMEIMKENVETIKAFNNAMYYGFLYESNEILTEGVGDFFKSAQEFIRRVIAKIKEVVSTFLMHLNAKLMDTEKFVNKYKEKLLKLDVDFEVTVHNFNVKQSEPNFDVAGKIVDNYNLELRDLQNKTHVDLIKERSEAVRLNKVATTRAGFIGQTQPLTNEEIARLYKLTVYGGKSVVVRIDSSTYKSYVNNFSDLKTKANEIRKDNDNITGALTELLLFFKQNPTSIYNEGKKSYSGRHISMKDNHVHRENDEQIFEDSEDTAKKVMEFFNYKYNEVSETISLINTLLNIKLSAVRDEVAQASKIIKSGLKAENRDDSTLKKGAEV